MSRLSTVVAAISLSAALVALPAQGRAGGGGGGHMGGFHGGGFHSGGGFRGDHDRDGRFRNRFFFHNRVFFGFGGFGFWNPWWSPWGWGWGFPSPYAYGYDPNAYAYAFPYGFPAAQSPLNAAPTTAPAQNFWYYCRPSNAYYPYVQSCPEAWQQVPTRPQ